MLILSYLVRSNEIFAMWKNQIDISNTFFVTWVESTAKIYGQPLGPPKKASGGPKMVKILNFFVIQARTFKT